MPDESQYSYKGPPPTGPRQLPGGVIHIPDGLSLCDFMQQYILARAGEVGHPDGSAQQGRWLAMEAYEAWKYIEEKCDAAQTNRRK